MSKVMGIYVKFTKTTHQIWSCHVTLASNSENFYFSTNSVLKVRKSYQMWGKLAQEQESYRKKQIILIVYSLDANFSGEIVTSSAVLDRRIFLYFAESAPPPPLVVR